MKRKFIKSMTAVCIVLAMLFVLLPSGLAASDDNDPAVRDTNAELFNGLKAAGVVNSYNTHYFTKGELRSFSGTENYDSTLMLNSKDIEDISGLQYCNGVKTIDLGVNDLSDLGGLTAFASNSNLLTKLTTLRLSNCHLNKLPALKMPNLEYLYLDNNSDLASADIGSLAALTHLRSILVTNTAVKDFSFLSGVSSLRSLSASSSAKTTADIDSLQYVTGQLTALDLGNVATEDSGLQKICGHFPNLTSLGISGGRITDISPLSGLTKLTDLDLSYNFVHDLTPLMGLNNCDIDLDYNALYTTVQQDDWNKLQQLQAQGCDVSYAHPYSFTVNYSCDASKGTLPANTMPSVGLYYEKRFNLPTVAPVNPAAVSSEGWNKAGGGTAKNGAGGEPMTASLPLPESQYNSSGNTYTVTYTALFAPVKYTVRFDSQGGSAVQDVTADYNTAVAAPADPVLTGYGFNGWYQEKECVNAWNFADKVTSSFTLYAKWTASTYTVSFDAQGGTGNAASKAVTYGQAYGALPALAKAGQIFEGWYTQPGGAGTRITETTPMNTAGDHTLYAFFSAVGTPGITKASSAGYNKVRIEWTQVANAAGYDIFASKSSSAGYGKVGTAVGTDYTAASLTCGTKYYFKVQAYRETAEGKVYGAQSAPASGTPLPLAPAGIKAKKASKSGIKVSWSAVPGASGYMVYQVKSSGAVVKLLKKTSKSAKSFTQKSLKKGKTYYYKVYAFRKSGSKTFKGPYSAVVHLKL
jgi:uncharacterized repeat protein (TIGR02543 family)